MPHAARGTWHAGMDQERARSWSGAPCSRWSPPVRLRPSDLCYRCAARLGHARVAETLLDSGAQIDKQDAYGQTALMHAATSGYGEMVRLLVARGADRRLRDSNCSSALDLAEALGHTAVAELLELPADSAR